MKVRTIKQGDTIRTIVDVNIDDLERVRFDHMDRKVLTECGQTDRPSDYLLALQTLAFCLERRDGRL